MPLKLSFLVATALSISVLGADKPVAPDARTKVVYTADFLDFIETDTRAKSTLQWEKNSTRYLYLPEGARPYLILSVQIPEKHLLSLKDQWIPRTGRKQNIKVELEPDPTQLTFRVYDTDKKFETYQLWYKWKSIPDGFESYPPATGQPKSKANDSWGRTPWSQLYSDSEAITILDLDAVRTAKLSFRNFGSADEEGSIDSWSFLLRDAKGNIIGNIEKLGALAPFVDWREVSTRVTETGVYSYQLVIQVDKVQYTGPLNQFVVVEGSSLRPIRINPWISLEPNAEMGYLDFSNKLGNQFSVVYFTADATVAIKNLIIFRGTSLNSLHNIHPEQSINYNRIGLGLRLGGGGENKFLGRPFLTQFDITLNQAGFVLSSVSPVRRFQTYSILLDSHLLLWAHNYIRIGAEFGMKTGLQKHFGIDAQYVFYVRPWSMKFGFGIGYDNLFEYLPTPEYAFQVIKSHVTLGFDL